MLRQEDGWPLEWLCTNSLAARISSTLSLSTSGVPLANQHEMSEKKRKRREERTDGRPSKRLATESPAQKISVSVIEDGDEWGPVLGECS